MFNRYLTYYKSSVQILTVFLLILISFLFAYGIDRLIVPLLTNGISYQDFSKPEIFETEAYVQVHRFLQLITQLIVFVIPAFLFAYLAFPKPQQYLKINTPLNGKHVLYALLIMLCSIPLIGLLEHLNRMIPISPGMQLIEDQAKLVTEAFLTTDRVEDQVFNFVIFVAAAAIGEELLFRGVFQNILLSSSRFKKQPFVAIALTALFFSLFHGQMSGLIPRFYAGFIIGCAYFFSNNLLVPILMHALNNGVVLIAFYVSPSTLDDSIGTLDYKDILTIVPLTIFSVFLIYKFYQQRADYTIDKVPIDEDETNFLANR